MKTLDQYHKWVEWSESDGVYLGKCPDLITGIHGDDPIILYRELCETLDECLQPLPELLAAGDANAVVALQQLVGDGARRHDEPADDKDQVGRQQCQADPFPAAAEAQGPDPAVRVARMKVKLDRVFPAHGTSRSSSASDALLLAIASRPAWTPGFPARTLPESM